MSDHSPKNLETLSPKEIPPLSIKRIKLAVVAKTLVIEPKSKEVSAVIGKAESTPKSCRSPSAIIFRSPLMERPKTKPGVIAGLG